MTASVLLCSLATLATANQELLFTNEQITRRALDEYTTNVFSPSFNNDAETMTTDQAVGLVIGLTVFGGFLLYALTLIIIDDCKRHKRY